MAKGESVYGPGIRTPSGRGYPFRWMAAAVAAWFNWRHPNQAGTRYGVTGLPPFPPGPPPLEVPNDP